MRCELQNDGISSKARAAGKIYFSTLLRLKRPRLRLGFKTPNEAYY